MLNYWSSGENNIMTCPGGVSCASFEALIPVLVMLGILGGGFFLYKIGDRALYKRFKEIKK